MESTHPQVLALDFDGLICDGLHECILVTWNGHYGKSTSDFSEQGLETIPTQFIQRFEHCRNFAKHLGHFAVSIFDLTTSIVTQADFEAIYQALDPKLVEQFVDQVTAYRHQVRQAKETVWLSQHTLYPGMKAFLSTINLPLYIVTAKDQDSVLKILDHAGVSLKKQQVFGEQRVKVEAFRQITQFEGITSEQLHFFDDNILNVIEAQKNGYRAHWATWGYNAPDHFRLAKEQSVSSLSLSQFLALPNPTINEGVGAAATSPFIPPISHLEFLQH